MKAKIYPLGEGEVSGIVNVPASKSMAHRAVICACLAVGGKSVIRNISDSYSDDIKATIEAMEKLGAKFNKVGNDLEIYNENLIVAKNAIVNCNESGSTLRFLIPLFSLLNSNCGNEHNVVFTGKGRLLNRPQSVYEQIFKEQGLVFKQTENQIEVNGKLKASVYEVNGNISSQFISGLLLTLPLLNADSTIVIKPPFESRSYVNLTLQVMESFGVKAQFVDDNTIKIKGCQKYEKATYDVEGDYSQLAFFAVLGAIKGNIQCQNVLSSSLQGDKVIVDIVEKFGANVLQSEKGITFSKNKLCAGDSMLIDLANCPDLGPIVTVAASYAKGKTTICNVERLRIKESDRVLAMETELRKLGVNISSTQNEIIVEGKGDYKEGVVLFSHNDHRIAMALTIFIACGNVPAIPVIIDCAECINKSYPNFFEDCKKLGIKIEVF